MTHFQNIFGVWELNYFPTTTPLKCVKSQTYFGVMDFDESEKRRLQLEQPTNDPDLGSWKIEGAAIEVRLNGKHSLICIESCCELFLAVVVVVPLADC